MQSQKKRKYNKRFLNREHGTSTPLVFTTCRYEFGNERVLSVNEQIFIQLTRRQPQ